MITKKSMTAWNGMVNALLTISGRDEVDALDALLQDTRLNRRRMQGAVRIIQQMINREL